MRWCVEFDRYDFKKGRVTVSNQLEAEALVIAMIGIGKHAVAVPEKEYINLKQTTLMIAFLVALFFVQPAFADTWKVTAYCSCKQCCGKSDGITASGKPAGIGTIACNWLKFGTLLKIGDKTYVVRDRGAKSQFGSFKKPIKHADIWMKDHREALRFGVQLKEVTIL